MHSLPELLADRRRVHARYPQHRPRDWRTPRTRPFFRRARDTPSACLYRLYEFAVVGWTTALRNELEYFCCSHPDWAVSALPDPADADPTRYAVLAVLTRLMCEAFNRRIECGLPRDAPPIIINFEELQARPKVYESPPEWAGRVPALQEKVFIPDAEGKVPLEDDPDVSEEFRAMNIIVQMPHIHFT